MPNQHPLIFFILIFFIFSVGVMYINNEHVMKLTIKQLNYSYTHVNESHTIRVVNDTLKCEQTVYVNKITNETELSLVCKYESRT